MEGCEGSTQTLFPMAIRRIGTLKLKRRSKPLSQCEVKQGTGKDLWPLTVLDKEVNRETGFLIRSISPCFVTQPLYLSGIPPMRKLRKGRAKPSHTPKGNSSDATIDLWSRSITPTHRPSTPLNYTRFISLKRKVPLSPKPPPNRPSRPELPRSYTKPMCGWEVTPP